MFTPGALKAFEIELGDIGPDHLPTVEVSAFAHGVPVGGELDYLDDGTLSAAMRQRTAF